jgi:hypothetical protein
LIRWWINHGTPEEGRAGEDEGREAAGASQRAPERGSRQRKIYGDSRRTERNKAASRKATERGRENITLRSGTDEVP